MFLLIYVHNKILKQENKLEPQGALFAHLSSEYNEHFC